MATACNSVCFRCYLPPKPLSDFVELFWYWRGHDLPCAKERVLPAGTVELVIRLNDGSGSDGGVSGPQSRYFVIERTTKDELLGIHFRQGGAFPFFPCSISELHNIGASLADVWSRGNVSELTDCVQETLTIDEKFRVLEQWLLLAASHPIRHAAVLHAIGQFRQDPSISSEDMAKQVGFSQRRFIQLFRNEVGLTPKLFCRVQRFQQVIYGLKNQDEVDWADVSLSSGYYDQAHFIHDFQEFTGLTPTEYLPLRTEHLNHVKIES